MSDTFNPHGTTILGVRRNGVVAIGGDGQVTLGTTVMKGNARKVRPLGQGKVLGGFAGGTADAFTLFERFEGKLDKFGNLTRAAIELAKDWRSDRYLRRLEALLLVGDVLDQQKRHADAIAAFGRIEQSSPLAWPARLRIADSLRQRVRSDSLAAPAYQMALSRDSRPRIRRHPNP